MEASTQKSDKTITVVEDLAQMNNEPERKEQAHFEHAQYCAVESSLKGILKDPLRVSRRGRPRKSRLKSASEPHKSKENKKSKVSGNEKMEATEEAMYFNQEEGCTGKGDRPQRLSFYGSVEGLHLPVLYTFDRESSKHRGEISKEEIREDDDCIKDVNMGGNDFGDDVVGRNDVGDVVMGGNDVGDVDVGGNEAGGVDVGGNEVRDVAMGVNEVEDVAVGGNDARTATAIVPPGVASSSSLPPSSLLMAAEFKQMLADQFHVFQVMMETCFDDLEKVVREQTRLQSLLKKLMEK
ncbi:hypothetical protein Scep_024336 [Stephania cephalantha]|uniref:Uncharacterized protein n=1 Tax=Stephania cephalantha TaxID=152367 RepID=A0AAP0HY64_9MAGN